MKSWRTWVLHTTWLCTLLRFWELLNQYSSSKNKWIGCGKRWWRNRSIPFIYCGLSTPTKTRSSPCLFVLLVFVVVLAEEFLEGVKFSISREQYWNTGFYVIIISVVSESHFDNKVRRPGNTETIDLSASILTLIILLITLWSGSEPKWVPTTTLTC